MQHNIKNRSWKYTHESRESWVRQKNVKGRQSRNPHIGHSRRREVGWVRVIIIKRLQIVADKKKKNRITPSMSFSSCWSVQTEKKTIESKKKVL